MAIQLRDLLHPMSGFQYSVNIALDINDEEKIKSFIPSTSSLNILEEMLASVQVKGSKKSHILSGAYGKGKSHLILAIISLLSGRKKELFSNITSKAKGQNEQLFNNIDLYMQGNKKLLPVVINAINIDLRSTLLYSLSTALDNASLTNLMPTTFFDVAIEKITDWEKNFPDTYKKFEKAVGISGNRFIDELSDFKQDSYNLFLQVFPTLTSGSKFNPIDGSDVIKVYDCVIDELKKQNYNGIFIVYDEFGKFLEGSADSNVSAMDIKLLQDIAERCNRDDKNQLHLLLISHKDIENYVGKLSKEKIDSWKAVSNRFTKLSMDSNDAEIYEIISQVLQKDKPIYETFLKENYNEFEELEKIVDCTNALVKNHSEIFKDFIQLTGKSPVKSCYPLHPYSLILLPKISELVAQNERTIFTFLSSNEKHTINYFLKSNTSTKCPIIEPDYIYDYFVSLFKNEPFGSSIRKQWQSSNQAIAKLNENDNNDLAIKIIKTIALIYVVNQFEFMPPSLDLLFEAYSISYSQQQIRAAIQRLKSENLLIELQFRPYVRISECSGNNIDNMIKKEISLIENNFNYKEILYNNLDTKYYYPIQYNDAKEITRYFEFNFLTYKELVNIGNIDEFIESINATGVIYAIIVDDEKERLAAIKQLSKLKNKRVIFILPIKAININTNTMMLASIENLIKRHCKDPLLSEELIYIRDDLYDLVNEHINSQYLRPESKKIEYYNQGKIVPINRKSQLSQYLSNICEELYANTPIIVNENINKNTLSSPMNSARQKILEGILENELRPNLGLKNGQDITVLRSVYVVTNIIEDVSNPEINFDNISDEFKNAFGVIKEFILSTGSENKCINDLYQQLMKPEFGIGMKLGIIPFYIAIIVSSYKKHITFIHTKKNIEIPLKANLLININDYPKDYCIKLENWDENKQTYIARLEKTFSKYLNNADREYSNFDYVTKAIQRWYLQLSKFDKETKKYCDEKSKIKDLSSSVIRFKNALNNPEINAREFIFDKLPNIFETKDYSEIVDKIDKAKSIIDNNLKNIITLTVYLLRKIFDCNEKESLTSVVKNYYDDLNEQTKTYVFDSYESTFIDTLKTVSNDEEKFVNNIIRSVFSLRLEDFNDELLNGVNDNIKAIKTNIDNYNNNTTTKTAKQHSYSISFIDKKGITTIKHFQKVKESKNAELLHNEIIAQLNDYADALSATEKSQVLLEILREICK